ncbi:cisplatin damage response ATP-dependent DNA ligase [Alteromonas sp. ASW11-19]|uniref:DNA ligase (ATP) n=1 Tax=Alteromonas salexigens TaxID=2982530 RepID=A0ABT2VMQ7_9ALTE|nr:cisplatin damage response ATP-dependent DNA ligase [Alteromonas salexigens]MCU7554602.1 cisplatin damage response ATP-dependent DNA ligase [Alteromonas salexigens]
MHAFSELLDQLYFTAGNNAKAAIITDYLAHTPDPDRGWAIAALAGTLKFDFFKRNTVKKLMLERVDPELFALSYDYVGEMSETVAHLWPQTSSSEQDALPSLAEVVEQFQQCSRNTVGKLLAGYLDSMTAAQRWALIKLGTRGLRVGVSARTIKHILASYGNVDVAEVEAIWHGVAPPYTSLLAWLEGRADKPDIRGEVTFHPVMLSHPLTDGDLNSWSPADWQVEHKYDGIRVQLVSTNKGKALFSRTGDDISSAFPDVLEGLTSHGVVDGELLIMHGTRVDTFNTLQQRLNRKSPTKKLLAEYPAGIILYDILIQGEDSVTEQPLSHRRKVLETWLCEQNASHLHISPTLAVDSLEELNDQYARASEDVAVEGLMLKRRASQYVAGRPKGQWYKWKRQPKLVDAVIMYAQRGHGKRSSFYSDFTFGAWQGDQLLPIGKAYSGFTDDELKKLDNWVRRHTVGRFGPVKEVKKELVIEVAFDAVHPSTRHKSGIALRFPRFHRIRWDKPAREADSLDTVKALIDTPASRKS